MEAVKKEAATEAAKKAAETRKENLRTKYQEGLACREELKTMGVYGRLTAESRAIINAMCIDPDAPKKKSNGKLAVLNVIYGLEPKVGMTVTLDDVMDRTLQGLPWITKQLKIWANSGIIVDYRHNKDKPKQSTYTITQLPE